MVNPEKCSGCDLCGMYCPDFAIFGFKNTDEAKPATTAAAPAPKEQEATNVDAR